MDRSELISRLRAASSRLPRVPHPGTFASAGEDADLEALLVGRMGELAGDQRVVIVEDRAELLAELRGLLDGLPPAEVLWEGETAPARHHAAGVARGVAALAASATVVLDPGDPVQGRVSLLVDHSILVVPRERVLSDVLDLAASPEAAARSGYMVHVSGASRTADIEKTLVSPAHGPARLTVILAPAVAGFPTREETTGGDT